MVCRNCPNGQMSPVCFRGKHDLYSLTLDYVSTDGREQTDLEGEKKESETTNSGFHVAEKIYP